MASKRTMDHKQSSRGSTYLIKCGTCGMAGGVTLHYVGQLKGKAVYTCTRCLREMGRG